MSETKDVKLSINVKEDYEKKTQIANEEINYNKIQDYMNNYIYKESYINIDSRFRNINPQNVIEMQPNYLPLNPISTFKNEFRVRVTIDGSSFSIGDKIVLQNIIKTLI